MHTVTTGDGAPRTGHGALRTVLPLPTSAVAKQAWEGT